MQWTDKGVLLKAKPYGETSYLVTLFTQNHGRYSAVLKTTSRSRGSLQPGNLVQATWSARLLDHLGTWHIEFLDAFSSRLFFDRGRLTALGAALSLTDQLLPERHPYKNLYHTLLTLLKGLASTSPWYESYAFYELKILEDLGFGLDLTQCAVTKKKEPLVYLSPKTGRGVCAACGTPYLGSLLKIPDFWVSQCPITTLTFYDSLSITAYFLEKNLLEKGLPPSRRMLKQLLIPE